MDVSKLLQSASLPETSDLVATPVVCFWPTDSEPVRAGPFKSLCFEIIEADSDT